MTRLKWFLIGSFAAVGLSAYAAGPIILGAIPLGSCTAISNVALSTTSETVIAASDATKSWCISNNDSSIAIYVAMHATATSADVRVGPGQTICDEINGGYGPTTIVDALAASGTPAIGGFSCR